MEFSYAFTPRDCRIISHMVRHIIDEYNEQLKPFSLFNTNHRVNVIIVRHESLPRDEHVMGYVKFHTDEVVIHAKPQVSYFYASGYANLLAHEIAHHACQEYFEGVTNQDERIGNNLVHHACNTNTYQFTDRYFDPVFALREGLVGYSTRMFDLRKLIDEREKIMINPTHGIHEIW